jgi:hypothetical protein
LITVLCWLWKQTKSRAEYNSGTVNTWAAMVRRNITIPHRIACVTDCPEGIDSRVEIIAPPGDFLDITNPRWTNGRPQCYRRLSMFRKDAGKIFGKRFVCMDLDCVVGGSLDPVFDRPEDLVLFKGTSAGRPYNGSMMLIKAGCRPRVFADFNQEAALESGRLYCGSDQAWLMHKLGPGEATWSEPDGVYWFNGRYRMDARKKSPRVLFFPGSVKPWSVAARFDPFIKAHYQPELKEAA